MKNFSFKKQQKKIITIKKALFLSLLLTLVAWQANSQELNNNADLKKNELKIDAAWLLGSTVKAEYEHFLNDWSSVGATAFYNFSEEPYFTAQILGVYRLYFGKEPMSGFFMEGNTGLVGVETQMSLGAGIALGRKWFIPKSCIVLDLYGGIGRVFGMEEPYPRAGISIGKRF